MAKRILSDYLNIPVYHVADYEASNGNIVVTIHVDPFTERGTGGRVTEWPSADFNIEISRLLVNGLEKAYPTPYNSTDERGFYSQEVYERKAQEYRDMHRDMLMGLARMIVGLWQKQVALS